MLEDRDMHIVQHLEELRKRIIITFLVFLLFLVMVFVYVQDIYHVLVKDLPFKLALLGPSDILVVYLMIASVVAIAVLYHWCVPNMAVCTSGINTKRA